MAVNIELKRSAVPGKIPSTSQLQLGELAVNTYDGKIYFKKNVNGTESILTIATSAGTGSITVDSASFAFYAANAGTAQTAATAPGYTLLTTFNGFTSSYYNDSSSFNSRILNNSSSITYLSSSFLAFSSSYNTGSFTGSFTGSHLGNLTGTASYATQALTASYVLNAISSSYSLSSSYATTASYVTLAQTASYVVTAQTASYVLNAVSSSYATTASYVQTAQTASYVLQAVSASYSTLAQTANTASYVVLAQTASYVITAQTASYVLGSNVNGTVANATNAVTAQTASYVLNAVSASYALSSSYAYNSTTASYAINATTVTYWSNQLADFTAAGTGTIQWLAGSNGDGYVRPYFLSLIQSFLGLGSNAYTSTSYLPLTGGSLTGVLTSNSDISTTTNFNAGSTGFLTRLLGGSANNGVQVNTNSDNTAWFVGSDIGLNNVAGNRNLNFKYFNGTTWNNYMYITPAGDATFNGNVNVNSNTFNLFNASTNSSIFSNYNNSNIVRLVAASNGNGYVGVSAGSGSLAIGVTSNPNSLLFDNTGAATFSSSVTGASFIKSGGTASQFLKADGSVDGNTYLTTSAASSTYQPLENQRLSTGNIPTFYQQTLTNGYIYLGGSTAYPQIVFKSTSNPADRTLYNGGDNNLVWRYDGTNDAIILNTYNYNSFALPLSGGTLTGNVSVTGNNKITFGPNTTWSQYLQVGGDGIDGSYAQVAASNGNLHLESLGAGYDTYINYYRGGSVRITNASSNLYLGGTFYDNANTAYLLKPSGASQMYQLYLNAGTKGLVLNNGTSNSISFGTAGVAAPTFTSYSAGVKIILFDNISSTSTGYTIGINSNTMFFTTDTTSSGYAWYAGTTSIATLSGAGAATFSSSVTATGFFNSSDLYLKNIINQYTTKSFGIVEYTWKDGRDNKTHLGYIAQEVEKFLPSAVMKDGRGYLTVNYHEAHAYKIRELELRIQVLEDKLKKYEGWVGQD